MHCVDNHGRSFIVEMQVARQTGFTKRILLNTAKVYSRQLSKKEAYSLAQPVYSLNILDHRLKPDENQWYHHYTFSSRNDQNDYIEDMQIILIELPKWRKLNKFDINKPQDRWLMYFTEPTLFDRLTPEECAKFTEISEALESLESKHFSPEKIRGYELYINNIRQYHTTMTLERQEGRNEGLEEGRKKGMKNLESALTDLKTGNPVEVVAARYELDPAYVDMLYRQFIEK